MVNRFFFKSQGDQGAAGDQGLQGAAGNQVGHLCVIFTKERVVLSPIK